MFPRTHIPRDACFPAHISLIIHILQVIVMRVSPGILFPTIFMQILMQIDSAPHDHADIGSGLQAIIIEFDECFTAEKLRMVICTIIGCSNRSRRDEVRFFRLPAVVKHQGEQMFSVTTKQRCTWLKAISRDDLTEDKLSNVFVARDAF